MAALETAHRKDRFNNPITKKLFISLVSVYIFTLSYSNVLLSMYCSDLYYNCNNLKEFLCKNSHKGPILNNTYYPDYISCIFSIWRLVWHLINLLNIAALLF